MIELQNRKCNATSKPQVLILCVAQQRTQMHDSETDRIGKRPCLLMVQKETKVKTRQGDENRQTNPKGVTLSNGQPEDHADKVNQVELKAGTLRWKHNRQSGKEWMGMGRYICCRADGKSGNRCAGRRGRSGDGKLPISTAKCALSPVSMKCHNIV